MKFKNIDFINLLISISTLCAVIVSYMTLSEIREGRSLAVLPDIFISNSISVDIEVDSTVLDHPYLGNYAFKINGDTVYEVAVPIRNLGFGPAKYIDIDWDIDMDYLNDKLDRNYGGSKKVNFIGRYFSGYSSMAEFTIEGFKDTLSILSLRKQDLNYLAPSLEKNISNKIVIPEELLILAMYNAQLAITTNKVPYRIQPKLNIGYVDLNGKRHKKQFICRFEFLRTGRPNIKFIFEEINNETLELTREWMGRCNFLQFDDFVLEDNYLRKEEIVNKVKGVNPRLKNICTGASPRIKSIRFVVVPPKSDVIISYGTLEVNEDLLVPETMIFVEELEIFNAPNDEIDMGSMLFRVH